jgi:hypothetical protein
VGDAGTPDTSILGDIVDTLGKLTKKIASLSSPFRRPVSDSDIDDSVRVSGSVRKSGDSGRKTGLSRKRLSPSSSPPRRKSKSSKSSPSPPSSPDHRGRHVCPSRPSKRHPSVTRLGPGRLWALKETKRIIRRKQRAEELEADREARARQRRREDLEDVLLDNVESYADAMDCGYI